MFIGRQAVRIMRIAAMYLAIPAFVSLVTPASAMDPQPRTQPAASFQVALNIPAPRPTTGFTPILATLTERSAPRLNTAM